MNIDIELNYSEAQEEIFFNHKEKFIIVTKGRRAGITQGGAQAFIEYAIDGTPFMLWGDTIQSNITKYYERYFQPALRELGIENYKWNGQDKTLKILESVIDFRSAEKPKNWEGFGYRKIFLNEAGIILANDYLFDNAVLPMMMDFSDSQLIAAGVPKGKFNKEDGVHKFYELYQKASKGEENYSLTELTSYDNPFLNAEDIEELELQFSVGLMRDQEIYGKFIDVTEKPFLYSFDEKKHKVPGVAELLNPHLPIRFSFDFNKDPMTCIVGQRASLNHLIVVDAILMSNGSTPEVCEQLIAKYPGWSESWEITGDATGRNRTPLERGDINHYKIIKRMLRLRDNQIFVRKANISHNNSRILCNSILQNTIMECDEDIDPLFIKDLQLARVDDRGKIVKTVSEGNHYLDCWRYLIDSEYPDFISNARKYHLPTNGIEV